MVLVQPRVGSETGDDHTTMNALRITASVFGVFAGIGGITHGIGEILQGNVAPSGIFFDSWVEGPIASGMGGDPAMSLVPNLLVTGMLALLVSIALIVWAVAFVRRPRGGWVLVLLSVVLLLVGGGVGPPVVGLLAGVAGLGIDAPLTWWHSHLSGRARSVLGALWPWALAVAALNGLFLFVGAIVLVYSFEVNRPDLFLNSFYSAVVSLLVAIVTGVAHDLENRGRAQTT